MYLVTKIENDGTKNPSFTLDEAGLIILLGMLTPRKCSFLIERIS